MTEALQQEIRTLKSVFESERDPDGRAFAPLADAYRRAGEIQQAVRLLNEGLARHPDFVPGHVVAAQLYVEQGLVEEARLAARHALELDGENVNALRSLLSVLEQSGDAEADEVRDRLTALDPRFEADGQPSAAAALANPPPLPDVAAPAAPEDRSADMEVADLDLPDLEGPPPLPSTEAPTDAPPTLDLPEEAVEEAAEDASEPLVAFGTTELDGVSDEVAAPDDESLIDLDSLSTDFSEVGVAEDDEPEAATDLALGGGFGLPTEEPVVELDDLTPVDATETEQEAETEPSFELPQLDDSAHEEPVMELADLGPTEVDEPVAVADLSPELPVDDFTGPEEPVMELADLAPAGATDEEPADLADLAPDEPVADLADLAPDEPVADLADLAPDEPAESGSHVVALEDLAPEPEDEAPVVELDALAPDEPVADLADLAPDEPVADLADLAPDEPVADLADLAPDEPVMEMSELAPEPPAMREQAEEEPVLEMSELAPSAADDGEEDRSVMELADLAPDSPEADAGKADEDEDDAEITMVGLMDRTAAAEEDSAPEARESADFEEEAHSAADAEDEEVRATAHDDEEDAPADAVEEEAHTAAEVEEGDTADADEDDDHEPGEPIYTRTLAELYVKQGAVGKAIGVYEHLLGLSPGDAALEERLEELRSGVGLEEHAEGVLSDEAEEEVEALARELAESGDHAHEHGESPFTLHGSGETSEDDEEAGPTIGEYFDGLLGWKSGAGS